MRGGDCLWCATYADGKLKASFSRSVKIITSRGGNKDKSGGNVGI